ncbi:Zinc finger MYM-type protein 4 [Nymphon striatum]|nr:Zinc finger MYM-type protein 4 [Nymphon striatum]
MARETGIPKSSSHRILKRVRWKCYIPTLTHTRNEDYPDRRVEFCEWYWENAKKMQHLHPRLFGAFRACNISNELVLKCDGRLILGFLSHEPTIVHIFVGIAGGFPAIVLRLQGWLMTVVYLNAPELFLVVSSAMVSSTMVPSAWTQFKSQFITVPSDSNLSLMQAMVRLVVPDVNHFDRQKRKQMTKTSYDVALLQKFLHSQGESRQPHEIPTEQLSNLLCKFFICVRKPDGTDYLPNTIKSFMYSFDRHLCDHDYKCSLKHGRAFSTLRGVIQDRQNELRSAGKVQIARESKTTTIEEIEILWELGQLGNHTPDSVINTLWFNNSIHFGLKGSHVHRDLRWGNIRLCTDSTNQEYLEYQERQPKTRRGTNLRDECIVKRRVWPTPDVPGRDPVALYKLYAAKRPQDYCNPNDPFYIATNKGDPMLSFQWFNRQPIGVNKLMTLMNRMRRACGLSEEKFLTDLSTQKHLVQKLSEQKIQPMSDDNVQSVKIDNHISQDQPKKISNVLSIPSSDLTTNTRHSNPTDSHLPYPPNSQWFSTDIKHRHRATETTHGQ